jgi:hypothetical protein
VTRRRAVAVAALVLLAVGCASSDDAPSVDGTSTTAVTTPDTTAPGAVAPPSTDGTAPAPGGTPRRTIIVGGTDAVPDRQAPAPGSGSPGDGAVRFLRPAATSRLQVEVQSQSGAQPPSAAIAHLRQVLSDATGKPVDVTDGGTPPVRSTWSAADVRNAAISGARPSAPEVGVLHLLYVHGSADTGGDTLGVSVASDVAVVFPDRIDDAAGGLASPSALVDAVTMHEVGHLLGLVDLVLHRGRQDPEHPGHSRNSGSVMYWAVESSLVGDLLTGGPPRDFDGDDRAELAAIRRG